MNAKLEDLIGNTMVNVERYNEEIIFTTDKGRKYKLYHDQDCCENVGIEDINGELSDLIGDPILMAEEVTNENEPCLPDNVSSESYTWTFYKFATIKGYITIRWLGTSNGYYSERVDFCEC